VARSRGAGGRTLGKVKGRACFDVDRGFLTRVKVTVLAEVEGEKSGARILISDESEVVRTDGNTLGIKAATANQR
jgi:hypothetical protein